MNQSSINNGDRISRPSKLEDIGLSYTGSFTGPFLRAFICPLKTAVRRM